jgi:hypothetical protein
MKTKWKETRKDTKNRRKEAYKYQQLLNKRKTNVSNIRKDKISVNENYIIFYAMTNVVIFRTPKVPKRSLPQ